MSRSAKSGAKPTRAAKPSAAASGPRTSTESGTAGTWSLRRRLGVSLLLTVHLLAVFIAPFTFAASGRDASSPFALALMNTLRPYIDMMYLNHGYFFFAPEPGPSHQLRCRLEFADGREPKELLFPDRRQQWPRLLYHRHFMLSEQLNSLFIPENPPTDEPEIMEVWRRERALYQVRRQSFEDHLRIRHGAADVTIVRVEHRPPSHAEALEGVSLTDPRLYRDLSETWDEVELSE